MADILAILSIASGFHVAERPSGMGNTVFCPCITSSPNRRGIPFPLLTASSCISRALAALEILNSPPICPFEMSPAISDSLAGPVIMSEGAVGRLSCPIFSSTDIFSISPSMNLSIFLSLSALLPCMIMAAEIISIDDSNFFIV